MFRGINLIFGALLIVFLVGAESAFAQRSSSPGGFQMPDASTKSGRPRGDDDNVNEGMLENRQRMILRELNKDHEETIERSADAARLSDELHQSFERNNSFGTNDAAKLDALEKQVKKIRKNLGGDDDKEPGENRPTSVADALEKLVETGAELHDELKESTRHTVSAKSIEDANAMLDLIGYIRTVISPAR